MLTSLNITQLISDYVTMAILVSHKSLYIVQCKNAITTLIYFTVVYRLAKFREVIKQQIRQAIYKR